MKMYCLVRKDLEKSYQAVQGGHAIAQYFIDHGIPDIWDNGTMVFLGVKDEDTLKKWQYKLSANDLIHSTFIEPDIGNELTALSIIDTGERFSKLSLLR